MTDTPLSDDVVERVAEAIGDFLDARFPDGAMPGGQQLFATDHLDAEFKHEAGCDALARAALGAARYGEMQTVMLECADDLEVELKARWCTEPGGSCHPALQGKFERDMAPVVKARALLSSIGASHE